MATVKKTFPVSGMSCASCAASVESTLKQQQGVLSAGVNIANHMASIAYKTQLTSPGKLKDAVAEIGFDLITDETADAAEQLEKQQKAAYQTLKQNLLLSAILSVPLVCISMLMLQIPYANYVMWALATPVVFIAGRQFFINGWKLARHGAANMDTLVALSTGIAYLFSVFNTLYPEFWHRQGLHAHVYFETAAVIVTFILTGKLLEERAKGKTSEAIKKLMSMQPDIVTVLHEDGRTEEIAIAAVTVNDLLLLKPGDRVPVDAVVTQGQSYVDESMLSGESVAVLKQKGDKVMAGTINQKGSLTLCAEKVGADTLLAHIIKTVQEAQGSKAPAQKLADKIAGIFVPVVLCIAVVTFLLWYFIGGHNGLSQGLMAMVTVLIIACPCALGLATPTAVMVGMGKGAENGILIKDAESMELIHKADTMVLDKTGTITEGKPELIEIKWIDDKDTAANVLYAMETLSEHPLATAVVSYYQKEEVGQVVIENFESVTSKGIKAAFAGENYYVGNVTFLQEQNIDIPTALQTFSDNWQQHAYTVVWFAKDGAVLAVIAIADKIKASTAVAIGQLKNIGLQVHMLTGDNEQTAHAIAKDAGINNYKANMLPAEKADHVKQLQAQGHVVAMAGDGINDTEALALADVSIAMGAGTDIAMNVAGITLLSSDLGQIPKAIKLSSQTSRVIKQNLFWAFIYNLIGIPLAAGVLYPVNGFVLNPMIAGAAMALSSVSVVSNSLRLRWAKL